MSCVHSGKLWRLLKSCTERSDNGMQKFDRLAGLHAQSSPDFWCRRCTFCSSSLDKNMEIVWQILQKIHVGTEGFHFIHTERQPWPRSRASEDAGKPEIHISRWYSSFFLSKFLLKWFTVGYFLLRATTKVEVKVCSFVPLKTQNIPKPKVSYRGMTTTLAQSNKEIESLVPDQHKDFNRRKKYLLSKPTQF